MNLIAATLFAAMFSFFSFVPVRADIAGTRSPLAEQAAQQATAEPTTSVVLAIDLSDSMAGKSLRNTKEAAHRFIDGIDKNVAVAIVTFTGRVQVAQDYTTDKVVLGAVIDSLRSGGMRALYDGSRTAVSLAANSPAQRKVVILLTNGVEAGAQSKSSKDDALKLAKSRSVLVYTVGLTNTVDRTYLDKLSSGTGAKFYPVTSPDDLVSTFTTLSSQFAPAPTTSASSQGVSLTDPQAGAAAPITAPVVPVAAVPNGGQAPAQPISNIVPIKITVAPEANIQSAELAINGTRVAGFNNQGPYEYDFDTSTLNAGQYTLTFAATNTNSVTLKANLDFEVQVVLPQTKAVATADASVDRSRDPAQVSPNKFNPDQAPSDPILTAAQRVLLINGKAQPFNFQFAPEKGLTVIEPLSTSTAHSDSISSILGKPFDLIPQPIKDGFLTQRPQLWALVIVLLTIILLPQGLFTLYYMMYTWNNPEVAEQYRSPKEYLPPQYSFTAILPARHEAKVIKDTIKAIDRIDYPDHLKEILVMIRDEDDDETIARTREAIAELGKSNTIRLITFTTGPKNKPNGLNRGLRAATNQVVCVFDAEDEPHSELYNVINTVMVRDGADVVQSGVQLMNFASNWFSALNCLEYFFWFKSGLHCFTRAFKVTPLGGNTVFFKKQWLQTINGWDEKCLTEDADVGIRLTLLGAKMQIVYDEKHVTQEETPATVESFIKQRTRWCQGFYEIFFKGDWLRLPSLKQKLTAMYILLNSLLQAGIVLYAPIGIYVAVTQRISVPVALLSWVPIFMLLLQLITNLIGIREFTDAYGKRLPFGFRLKMTLYYLPYQLLLAAAAARAVSRFVTRKNAWEKTSHANLHRQNQSQNQAVGQSI